MCVTVRLEAGSSAKKMRDTWTRQKIRKAFKFQSISRSKGYPFLMQLLFLAECRLREARKSARATPELLEFEAEMLKGIHP